MSDYPSVAALLARHGLRPKKAWGQNFLHDRHVVERIARTVGGGPEDRVLELGAGLGHLTAALAAGGAQVVAVERDRELVPVLEERWADTEQVQVLAADAKRIDLAEVRGDGPPLLVAGNLPYHLTSPILFHLLAQREHLTRIVVMVQKEVAQRMAAEPGNRVYGVLSVRFQLWCDVSVAFDVPPGAFTPPPKVTSAVVRLQVRDAPLADPGDPEVFRRVVKAAFAQRRKTLHNSIRSARLIEPDQVDAALLEAGLDPGLRAERVPVTGFAALSRAVSARLPDGVPPDGQDD